MPNVFCTLPFSQLSWNTVHPLCFVCFFFFHVRFFRYQRQCKPLFSSDLPGCRRACRPRLSEWVRIWCGSQRAVGSSVVRVPLSWLRHHRDICSIVRCRTWRRGGDVAIGGYGPFSIEISSPALLVQVDGSCLLDRVRDVCVVISSYGVF